MTDRTNILGLDLSLTGTGIALLTSTPTHTLAALQNSLPRGSNAVMHLGTDGRQCIALKVDTSKLEGFSRWRLILETVLAFERVATHIVIENYSFGSPFRATPLAELGGIIKYALCDVGRTNGTITFAAPTQVKKFLGVGKGEKNTVLLHVFKRYGIELTDDNTADALVLAKIGEALSYGTDGLPQFQQEVIAALKTPKVRKARKTTA